MGAMELHPTTDLLSPAEMMLAHLPVAVALFDARDLRLLQANPCFHAILDPQWQQGRAIGHRLTEMFPQAEHTGRVARFRQVAATGIPYQTEAYASSALARGLTYWDWSLKPIRDADGQVTHLLLTLIDVTARVAAQQQAQLTAVLGFCDLLQQYGREGLNEMQAYAITSIAEQSEYLTYLVNEILNQSALEHASFELQRTNQNLLPLLTQAIEQQRSTNKKHHIQLRMEGLSSQTRLMGQFDSYKIIQVLNNVLTNAIKYSPSGSTIELGIRPGNENSPERNTVLLWVKDQGPGIAPADLPHIFERFYRAEKRDQAVGGLGLGLYLAKELIQRHGGRIWVESTEGVGTTFFLVFPLSLVEQKES